MQFSFPRRQGSSFLHFSLNRVGVPVTLSLLLLLTTVSPTRADEPGAALDDGPAVVSFCLQPPLSGSITFSDLTFRDTPPPSVRATARGLPPSMTLGILWDQIPGYPHGGPYLVANVTTDQAGQAMPLGKGFRQPDHPAERIILIRIENRRSVRVGEGSPCATRLPSTGGAPASIPLLIGMFGFVLLLGGLVIRLRIQTQDS